MSLRATSSASSFCFKCVYMCAFMWSDGTVAVTKIHFNDSCKGRLCVLMCCVTPTSTSDPPFLCSHCVMKLLSAVFAHFCKQTNARGLCLCLWVSQPCALHVFHDLKSSGRKKPPCSKEVSTLPIDVMLISQRERIRSKFILLSDKHLFMEKESYRS